MNTHLKITPTFIVAQALRRLLTFILFFPCASFGAQAGAIQQSAPIPLNKECRTFLATLPSDEVKGWLTTTVSPEDLRPIAVFFHHHPFHGSIPWIYFNGGPLDFDHSKDFDLVFSLEKAAPPSIIYLDQRGTGCSSPMELKDDSNLGISEWASRGIVRDAEKLRKALGIKVWNAIGDSYGGLIVRRYIANAPGALKKVISHGYYLLDPQTFTKDRTRWQINPIEAYFKKYPGDIEILKQVSTQFPCGTNGDDQDCGLLRIRSLIFPAMVSHARWSVIHQFLPDLLLKSDEAKKNSSILETGGSDSSDVVEKYIKVVIAVDEGMPFWDMNICKEVADQLQAEFHTDALAPLLECYGSNVEMTPELTQMIDSLHDFYVSQKDIENSLAKNPQIQFYITASIYDYYVSFPAVQAEVKALAGRATFVPLMKSGHDDAFWYEPEMRRLMLQ
jgi:pimeloyl-ACP methyl ester carboxylesterase